MKKVVSTSGLSLGDADLVSDVGVGREDSAEYKARLLPYLFPDPEILPLFGYEVAKIFTFARIRKVPLSPDVTSDESSAVTEGLDLCSKAPNTSVSMTEFYRAAASSFVALELAAKHLRDPERAEQALRQISAGAFTLTRRSCEGSED